MEWYQLVWSRYVIAHHAIHLWLVMRRRLKTQDRGNVIHASPWHRVRVPCTREDIEVKTISNLQFACM